MPLPNALPSIAALPRPSAGMCKAAAGRATGEVRPLGGCHARANAAPTLPLVATSEERTSPQSRAIPFGSLVFLVHR